jgi:hypothetical protein
VPNLVLGDRVHAFLVVGDVAGRSVGRSNDERDALIRATVTEASLPWALPTLRC